MMLPVEQQQNSRLMRGSSATAQSDLHPLSLVATQRLGFLRKHPDGRRKFCVCISSSLWNLLQLFAHFFSKAEIGGLHSCFAHLQYTRAARNACAVYCGVEWCSRWWGNSYASHLCF